MKKFAIVLTAALVVALPFLFRRGGGTPASPDTLALVVVTPHNEAIRQSFAEGFSRWHRERYGVPVRVDWRAIGGTTEIMRYLEAEYASSAKRHLAKAGLAWPADGAAVVFAGREPESAALAALWRAFRAADDPAAVSCGIDLFFGGGVYDHGIAAGSGLTVPAWPSGDAPCGIFEDGGGRVLIPRKLGGEQWRTETYYGAALSTFGICCNLDRLKDLGIADPPATWADLTDPRYRGQIGLTDPAKSGSVAKTFEMIIHTCCAGRVAAAGFTRAQIEAFEQRIAAAALPPGEMPSGVPPEYQQAVERGWIDGVQLVRRLGAQSRYFTVSAGKVPVDVSMGLIAAGLCIDFYGRYQSELSLLPEGRPVMRYTTPVGGSSVTADPIALLRGARNREVAVRFIAFVLGEEGQKLWNYRRGAPGGPSAFSLRRLPIRRDFYPSEDPALHASFLRHKPHLSDQLWRQDVDAYQLAEAFQYYPRWTGRHFGIQRDLIKAMCLDSGDELRAAWAAIVENGGPDAAPEAMRAFEALPGEPYPLNWRDAVGICAAADRLELLRVWTAFFRENYSAARASALRARTTLIDRSAGID